jgi:predicted DNA-binding transcriptional regulator AlpA
LQPNQKKAAMETITHNNLPEAVGQIFHRLGNIEALLLKQEHAPAPAEEEFINLKQGSILTGYAPPTIYGLIGKNAIPHFKKGQRLFFEKAAILTWIREGKRKSKAEIEASADEHLQKLKIKRR